MGSKLARRRASCVVFLGSHPERGVGLPRIFDFIDGAAETVGQPQKNVKIMSLEHKTILLLQMAGSFTTEWYVKASFRYDIFIFLIATRVKSLIHARRMAGIYGEERGSMHDSRLFSATFARLGRDNGHIPDKVLSLW